MIGYTIDIIAWGAIIILMLAIAIPVMTRLYEWYLKQLDRKDE